MTLNSPAFLFLFLPAFLASFALAGRRLRAPLLLFFSLGFFLWSEPLFFPFIFTLALLNASLAQTLQKNALQKRARPRLLAAGVTLNLLCLLFFKVISAYWVPLLDLAGQAGFAIPNRVISLLPRVARLPLGFSFLTFQAISMLVDASQQPPMGTVSLVEMLNYLLMFPKAIAGPLVRLDESARQLRAPDVSLSNAASGLRRFMFGFAKKTLIADQLALISAGGLFEQAPNNIPTGVAWLVLLAYSLQLYFDFSAYSDMAIGLGQALGLRFVENFNYPYLATSIADFWRRWHISLSTWFRDYVFYPLERKRRSYPWLNQRINLLIVFLLTGLWHGVIPTFILWGLLHGGALALEQGPFGAWLRKQVRPLRHLYALVVILAGWVFFRSPDLVYAWGFFKSLAGFSTRTMLPFSIFPPVSTLSWAALAVALLFCFPTKTVLEKALTRAIPPEKSSLLAWVFNLLALALFIGGIVVQAGSNYQPFIYGEF